MKEQSEQSVNTPCSGDRTFNGQGGIGMEVEPLISMEFLNSALKIAQTDTQPLTLSATI